MKEKIAKFRQIGENELFDSIRDCKESRFEVEELREEVERLRTIIRTVKRELRKLKENLDESIKNKSRTFWPF